MSGQAVSRLALLALALSAAGACGGASPEPVSTPPAAKPADAAGDTKSDREGEPEVRGKFMAGCVARGSQDYCDCAWGAVVAVVPADKRALSDLSDADGAEITKAIVARCLDKMPESEIRESYLKGCVVKGTETLCGCLWVKLRKGMSAVDIARSDPKAPEVNAVTDQAVKQCLAENPRAKNELAARQGFMKGCSKGDEIKLPVCICAWMMLRKQYSLEQIRDAGKAPPADWEASLQKIREACASGR